MRTHLRAGFGALQASGRFLAHAHFVPVSHMLSPDDDASRPSRGSIYPASFDATFVTANSHTLHFVFPFITALCSGLRSHASVPDSHSVSTGLIGTAHPLINGFVFQVRFSAKNKHQTGFSMPCGGAEGLVSPRNWGLQCLQGSIVLLHVVPATMPTTAS